MTKEIWILLTGILVGYLINRIIHDRARAAAHQNVVASWDEANGVVQAALAAWRNAVDAWDKTPEQRKQILDASVAELDRALRRSRERRERP